MSKSSLNSVPGPPLLEQLGALCSLMAHDLANHLCVISGSASFAQLSLDDPQRLAAALEAIVRASEIAGHSVSSFGEYRRTLPTAFPPGPAQDVVDALGDFAQQAGWKSEPPKRLEGSVLLPPRWAVFAAGSIKTEICSKPVVLTVSATDINESEKSAAEPTDATVQDAQCRPGLLVRFAYRSAEAFSMQDVRARFENLGLLAAFELNRMLGGELDSRTSGRGNQEIDLWLPFE